MYIVEIRLIAPPSNNKTAVHNWQRVHKGTHELLIHAQNQFKAMEFRFPNETYRIVKVVG